MKKLIVLLALLGFSNSYADSLRVSTTAAAFADQVGDISRPGLLLKFDLPVELRNARIDLAYLRFKVDADTIRKSIPLLVQPMLQAWASGQRLASLSNASVSADHSNLGRLTLKSGKGEIEITHIIQAWQKGELQNLGLLVYPARQKPKSIQPNTLPTGGVAELDIFYTPQEKPDSTIQVKQ